MSLCRSYPALLCSALILIFGLPLSVAAASQPASDGASDAPLRVYYSANGLLNRGLYELAADEYAEFLSAHGDHEKAPVARYGLAVCLFRTGQYEKAVTELTHLRRMPGFTYGAEVGTMLGRCQLAVQRPGPAAEAFAEVVERYEGHDLVDDAATGLIEALYLDGRPDEAVQQCRAFVSRHADSPLRERAEFFGGLAEMRQKDYAGAARRFTGLLERYPKGQFAQRTALLLAQCHHHDNSIARAIRAYREVLKQTTGEYKPDALLGLGMLLHSQGDHEEAGASLDQLLQEFPASPVRETARLQRGRVWFDQGRFDMAATAFEQVAGKKSDLQDDAVYWIAKCKLREGSFDQASERLERAIKEFSQSDLLAEMYYDRGIAYLRGGKHSRAIAALKEFRAGFPDHALAAEALHLLAATEHQQGRYDESRAYCEAFMKQYPDHESAASVRFLAGENEYLDGRYAEAAEAFGQFISKYPQDEQIRKAKYRLGTALYRLQRFDEAEPVLSEIAGEAGNDPVLHSAWLALGDLSFQRGEWKQAERSLSEYISAGLDAPSADDALIKLGLSCQRQEKHEDALRAYNTLLERFPDSPHLVQALFESGQVRLALKRYDEAAELFERVLREENGGGRFTAYALNHLGTIALERGDNESSAEYFSRAVREKLPPDMSRNALLQRARALMSAGRFKDAGEVFSRFVAQNPSHKSAGYACAQLGIALARQGRHAEAIETIERLERQFAEGLDPSLRRTVQYEKAWCLRELGRTEGAVEAYRALLDEASGDTLQAHALLELAEIQERAKRYDAGAALLHQLRRMITSGTDVVPPDVQEQGTYRLAVCEFELERYQEASQVFEEFVTRFPESPLAASGSFFCGESFFKIGRHERAVAHLDRVVEKYTEDPLYAPSLLRLGECLAALQHWPRSEQVFTEYLNRFGDSEQWYQARFGIGWAREQQKRYDEAISAYRQVAARHPGPTGARAQFQIGECLFAKKKYEEAARELLKVDILFAYPEWSAGALYEAGRCFEKLGKPVEARAQFKAVIDKHKGTRWAEMATEKYTKVSGGDLPGKVAKQAD